MRKIKPGILLFFLAIAIAFTFHCQSRKQTNIETFTVKRGDFTSSLTETGELQAVNSVMITAPMISGRYGMKITKLVEDGKLVKEGDIVAEFDKAEVQKGIDDAKAELEIAMAEVRKAKATNESRIKELQYDLQKSELQYQISKLKLEQAVFEAEITRKQIELDLEQAGFSLQKAGEEIENQKNVNKEEESKLDLRVRQARAKLADAQETMEKFTVKAPGPGIAIIGENWSTDQKFQVDDQAYSGWPLVGLPDLSLMRAKVVINEVDIAKIDTLQQARIRLDAHPDTSFKAHITDIATLARNKERDSKVKVFDVDIQVDENDSTFMPGMTVSCEIIINIVKDTLFVPIEAIFKKEGETIVYVKNGSGFDPRKVELGEENDDYVIIQSGLKENDQVTLSDPTILDVPSEDKGKKNGEKKA